MPSDVLARAYLVSSAANPKGLSERANPQGLSSAWYKPRLGSPSHSTAEVLRQGIARGRRWLINQVISTRYLYAPCILFGCASGEKGGMSSLVLELNFCSLIPRESERRNKYGKLFIVTSTSLRGQHAFLIYVS